jgi:hypothetical protein
MTSKHEGLPVNAEENLISGKVVVHPKHLFTNGSLTCSSFSHAATGNHLVHKRKTITVKLTASLLQVY